MKSTRVKSFSHPESSGFVVSGRWPEETLGYWNSYTRNTAVWYGFLVLLQWTANKKSYIFFSLRQSLCWRPPCWPKSLRTLDMTLDQVYSRGAIFSRARMFLCLLYYSLGKRGNAHILRFRSVHDVKKSENFCNNSLCSGGFSCTLLWINRSKVD